MCCRKRPGDRPKSCHRSGGTGSQGGVEVPRRISSRLNIDRSDDVSLPVCLWIDRETRKRATECLTPSSTADTARRTTACGLFCIFKAVDRRPVERPLRTSSDDAAHDPVPTPRTTPWRAWQTFRRSGVGPGACGGLGAWEIDPGNRRHNSVRCECAQNDDDRRRHSKTGRNGKMKTTLLGEFLRRGRRRCAGTGVEGSPLMGQGLAISPGRRHQFRQE